MKNGEHEEEDIDTNYSWSPQNILQELGKEIGGTTNQRYTLCYHFYQPLRSGRI